MTRTADGPGKANSAPAGTTILVVDDEPTLRRVVRRVLEGEGFVIEEAEDGETALALVQSRPQPYALVLTDIQMPRINGHRVAAVLRKYRPSVPVICMSGNAGSALGVPRTRGGRRPIDSGAPFLAKPFTAETLTSAVRETLDRATHLSSRARSALDEAVRLKARAADRRAAPTPARKRRVDLIAVARRMRLP